MIIEFSRHARRQMKWRKILPEEVKDIIANPEHLEDSLSERKNAFKVINGRMIKVIYKFDQGKYTVITAMIKER